MSRNVLIGVIVAGLILAGIVYFAASQSGSREEMTLTISSDKPTYRSDEAIHLLLRLSNTGEAAACVSDRGSGSIVFNSITRDGNQVEMRSVPADYITAFPKLLEASLRPVGPGESLQITLSSENDPGLGARALSTTVLEDDTGIVTFYNVEEPGRYALELAYLYTGPEFPECDRVFKGPSNTVNVTFTVTQ